MLKLTKYTHLDNNVNLEQIKKLNKLNLLLLLFYYFIYLYFPIFDLIFTFQEIKEVIKYKVIKIQQSVKLTRKE